MIILDTNVVSEPMKPQANPLVKQWLDRQDPETLYLTAVNLAELLAGVEQMSVGQRQNDLWHGLTRLLRALFDQRILPFDQREAEVFAQMSATVRASGRVLPMADGQIAAIAATHVSAWPRATSSRSRLPGCPLSIRGPSRAAFGV
ncbi:type II toxin-antitoxin system VapC family toxin [Endozoicomonas sp. G2_2]|uniref:type II toxin-antitoxin system VapC family toxin n=1 Tax=Gammaproteobacteria TaxID=1236 RepID=UPI0032AE9649